MPIHKAFLVNTSKKLCISGFKAAMKKAADLGRKAKAAECKGKQGKGRKTYKSPAEATKDGKVLFHLCLHNVCTYQAFVMV